MIKNEKQKKFEIASTIRDNPNKQLMESCEIRNKPAFQTKMKDEKMKTKNNLKLLVYIIRNNPNKQLIESCEIRNKPASQTKMKDKKMETKKT